MRFILKGLQWCVLVWFLLAALHRRLKSQATPIDRRGDWLSQHKDRILLANSEASKFRLAFHFFEGTEAWKKLGGNLGCMAVK